MPRFRFNWTNLSSNLLRDLAGYLRITGTPAEGLRRAYGARPRDEFVRDTWPVLLSAWLEADRRAARRAAHRLRERAVGNLDASSDVEYLRSLRNTSGLREVILQLFIELGEQTASDRTITESLSEVTSVELLAPDEGRAPEHDPGRARNAPTPPVHESTPDEDTDSDESERDRLFSFIGDTISEMLGHAVHVDEDGDFAIVAGSAVVFVSIPSEPSFIRFFSPLVRNLPDQAAIYPLINSVNLNLPLGRLTYSNDTIMLEHNLLPLGLSAAEIKVVVGMLSNAADFFDHRIQDQLGGETLLDERADDEIDV